MGIGHTSKFFSRKSQFSFSNESSVKRFSYGGAYRNKRSGRTNRPLSHKSPIHLVFKVHRSRLRHKTLRFYQAYNIIQLLIKKYAKHFNVSIEQVSIQYDHVHILARSNRKQQFLNFFRVLSGQIAQNFEKTGLLNRVTDTLNKLKKGTGLWMYRPFSRIVFGWKAYQIVRNYIQLNEKEALGQIKYSKLRLRGLSMGDWNILWT